MSPPLLCAKSCVRRSLVKLTWVETISSTVLRAGEQALFSCSKTWIVQALTESSHNGGLIRPIFNNCNCQKYPSNATPNIQQIFVCRVQLLVILMEEMILFSVGICFTGIISLLCFGSIYPDIFIITQTRTTINTTIPF